MTFNAAATSVDLTKQEGPIIRPDGSTRAM
jgi:hypothetical protein